MKTPEPFLSPEHYQRELRASYLELLAQGNAPTRYKFNGRFYELRDCNSNDVSQVALRDRQLDSYILGYDGLIKRLVSVSDKPDVPVGFHLAKNWVQKPDTLEVSYQYVSPEYRKQHIALVQLVDLLLYALNADNIKALRVHVFKGQSNFYESFGQDICSSTIASKGRVYEIDLRNKELVKRRLMINLKEVGLELVN